MRRKFTIVGLVLGVLLALAVVLWPERHYSAAASRGGRAADDRSSPVARGAGSEVTRETEDAPAASESRTMEASAHAGSSTRTATTMPRTRYSARARPLDGILGWDPAVVKRTASGVVAHGGEVRLSAQPGVEISTSGLLVDSGWYHYELPWDTIDYVYQATADAGQVEVLCIRTAEGEVLVLSDLDFGDEASELVDQIARFQGSLSDPASRR